MSNKPPAPTLSYEKRLWSQGYRHVAGLDEAGRGAWAGPVVAAAVILPPNDPELAGRLAGVRDSKLLTPARREALMDVIGKQALALGVGAVPAAAIDALGIVAATRRAMALALDALTPPADYLLIDYLSLPDCAFPQEFMPHGDLTVLSIAAASIIAKVCRDRMMDCLESLLPGYGFGKNKGYGTEQHQVALKTIGPSASHRFSFAPLQDWRAFPFS
ncbi:MAG: ribonuclease HII [Anaerolineae bacterium]